MCVPLLHAAGAGIASWRTEALLHSSQSIIKSDHFEGTRLLGADFEKVLAVIDGGSFLWWMQEGELGGGGGAT